MSGTPIWIPRTEAELREAVESGILDEGDHCDFKRTLDAGPKGNLALAVDLASLAVNGGLIVVGVDEGPPKTLSPAILANLAERVDQVARSRCDPPLSVTTFPIGAQGRPGEGYLVIAVPASPAAPHSVEHVYRGRADRTNVALRDADVRRIWEERRAARVSAENLLPDIPSYAPPVRAILRVAFQPEYGDREALLRAVRPNAEVVLRAMADRPAALTHPWDPDINGCHRFEPRPGGWALSTGRIDAHDGASYALALEFGEDGGIRLTCDRGGEPFPGSGVNVVHLNIVAGLTWRAAELTRSIAKTTGYVGNWLACLRLGPIAGYRGYLSHWQREPILGYSYVGEEYRAAATFSFAELDLETPAVVERLVGGLGRALTGRDLELPSLRDEP